MPLTLRSRIPALLIVLPALILPTLSAAAWAPTNGPGGKPVMGLAVDGADLYLMQSPGDLFRSRDHGDSWQDISAPGDLGFRTCMAEQGGAVYLGTYRGVYKRSGDGAPWTRMNTGLEDTTVQALAFSGATLLAGTGRNGHLYSSTDQGGHWTRLNAAVKMDAFLSFAIDGTDIYAGTGDGIVYSHDDGATWDSMHPDADDVEIQTVAVNAGFVFARTVTNFYRSADKGLHWARITPATPSAYPLFRSFDPIGSRIYAASLKYGLFSSADNGGTWNLDSSFFFPSNTGSTYKIMAVGADLIAGSDRGAYRSKDQGVTWAGVNKGLGGSHSIVSLLATAPDRIFAATTGGYFSTSDAGAHWTLAHTGNPGQNIDGFAYLGGYLVTASDREGIYRSPDLGATWEKASGDWSEWGLGRVQAIGSDLYLPAADRGLLKSADTGKTWATEGVWNGVPPFDLLSAPGGVFAGTDDGVYAYRASDHSWSPLPSAFRGNRIGCMAAQGPILMAATLDLTETGTLYRSADNGATWTQSLDTTRARRINALATHGADTYAGTDSGLFLSRDQGATWIHANQGLPPGRITALLMQGDTLYAGISEEGIWKGSVTDIATGTIRNGLQAQARGRRAGVHWTRTGKMAFTRADGGAWSPILYDANGKGSPARARETGITR